MLGGVTKIKYWENIKKDEMITESEITYYLKKNIRGIKTVEFKYNYKFNSDKLGRPPYCCEVIIDGGESCQILSELHNHMPAGFMFSGKIYGKVVSWFGECWCIGFSRPDNSFITWEGREITNRTIKKESIFKRIINYLKGKYDRTIYR